MLRILLCVKQVPDVDLVKMDPETGSLIREGVPAIMNPNDMYALEAAVRVKERWGAEICAISMGPPAAESVLRECLSVGTDRAVLISDGRFRDADTLATSYSIAAAAGMYGKFDLILCGRETLDGATGQMGAQLAERFDTSLISGARRIVEIDESGGLLRAEREVEDGLELVEAKLPCLLSLEKTYYQPRIPNFRGKKAARAAEVKVLTASDIEGLDETRIGAAGSGTIVPRTYPPERGERGPVLDGGSAEKDAELLAGLLERAGLI